MSSQKIRLNTFRVYQNTQEFLIGIFNISSIRKFTKFTQRIIVGYDDNNLPEYNDEIQRKLSPTKVEQIADFLLLDKDAMFPTNILLSVPNQVIDEIEDKGKTVSLTLKEIVSEEIEKERGDVYLTIVDGQHRIRGIEKAIERLVDLIHKLTEKDVKERKPEYTKELKNCQEQLDRLSNFELIVSFILDPTLEYQAMLFSTINRTQTRVSENLVYDLFGLTTKDSPQKSSLEIILALNANQKSPLHNRIRLSGALGSSPGASPLSQATAVKSVLKFISGNIKEAEKERHYNRKDLLNISRGNAPFRNYYAKSQDKKIVEIMFRFFNAVKVTFKNSNGQSYWEITTQTKNVLQTTLGYEALMLVLKDILLYCDANEKDIVDEEYYIQKLKKAKDINFEDIGEKGRYPLTSKSKLILHEDMMKKIGIKTY